MNLKSNNAKRLRIPQQCQVLVNHSFQEIANSAHSQTGSVYQISAKFIQVLFRKRTRCGIPVISKHNLTLKLTCKFIRFQSLLPTTTLSVLPSWYNMLSFHWLQISIFSPFTRCKRFATNYHLLWSSRSHYLANAIKVFDRS